MPYHFLSSVLASVYLHLSNTGAKHLIESLETQPKNYIRSRSSVPQVSLEYLLYSLLVLDCRDLLERTRITIKSITKQGLFTYTSNQRTYPYLKTVRLKTYLNPKLELTEKQRLNHKKNVSMITVFPQFDTPKNPRCRN